MNPARIIWAGLPVLAMAGLLACQSDAPESNRQVASPESEGYKSPGEVRFLYDDEGNVPLQLPVEVLQDMRRQLQEQGQDDLLKDLEARYDLVTGEVKDLRAAASAERFLKSRLSKAAPAAPVLTPMPINPDELPAGIRIPEELAEGLKQAAAKRGAQ